jgi:hypothetical protein
VFFPIGLLLVVSHWAPFYWFDLDGLRRWIAAVWLGGQSPGGVEVRHVMLALNVGRFYSRNANRLAGN